jgi:hypothetical protein
MLAPKRDRGDFGSKLRLRVAIPRFTRALRETRRASNSGGFSYAYAWMRRTLRFLDSTIPGQYGPRGFGEVVD